MRRVHHARLVAAAFILHSAPAFGDELVLDLATTLARAAEAAPAAVSARGRIGEAEAGPRFADETSPDVSARVEQTFGLGGRRAARRALAEAEVAHARASSDATLREVRLDAALAFLDAVHAQRLVEEATAALALA